jgi:hypothetical protein
MMSATAAPPTKSLFMTSASSKIEERLNHSSLLAIERQSADQRR